MLKDKTTLFQGKIFDVARCLMEQDGKWLDRDLVIHSGGAAVIVCVDDKILLVRQMRAAADKKMLEIPAGMVDPGEDPKCTAMRELNEETGMEADELKQVFRFYPTPGYDTETITVFEAIQPRKAACRKAMDDNESIETLWMDLDEAFEKVQSMEIQDAKTILAIQYLMLQKLAGR